MTLLEAIRLIIAADDAYDPIRDGTDYDAMDAAAAECKIVLSRRPGASGSLVDLARRFIAWNADDNMRDDGDWNAYDAIIHDCRAILINPCEEYPDPRAYPLANNH